MTAETDLLPLPEPVAVKYPDSGLRDDEHALRLWAAHGYDTGGEPLFSAEQLREATAPLQAEIEALRAEVERVTCELMDATTRADKLEEALREAQPFIGWTGSYPELHAKIDALLREQEEGK
jgi:hypothetical protein